MYLIREVFQLKYGQMNKVMPALRAALDSGQSSLDRVLTDLSGPHYTLILERKVDSLDAWRESMLAEFASADPERETAMASLIDHGRREIYVIEHEA